MHLKIKILPTGIFKTVHFGSKREKYKSKWPNFPRKYYNLNGIT